MLINVYTWSIYNVALKCYECENVDIEKAVIPFPSQHTDPQCANNPLETTIVTCSDGSSCGFEKAEVSSFGKWNSCSFYQVLYKYCQLSWIYFWQCFNVIYIYIYIMYILYIYIYIINMPFYNGFTLQEWTLEMPCMTHFALACPEYGANMQCSN